MSGFEDMDTNAGDDRFLRISGGEIVQINIVSKEPKRTVNHWINRKKVSCVGKDCENCADGDQPRPSWRVNVTDRKTGTTKEFEFGTQIAKQIKTIAEILKESEQTIHDVDLRIKRIGSSMNDTEYFVNQVPKRAAIPAPAKKQQDEAIGDEVPF